MSRDQFTDNALLRISAKCASPRPWSSPSGSATEEYNRTQKILSDHYAALKALAKQLLDHETIDGRAIREILATMAHTRLTTEVNRNMADAAA